MHSTLSTLAIRLSAGLLLLGSTARADVIMLGAQQDNTLYEDPKGQSSNGAGSYFFCGMNGGGLIRRAVLAFDIAGAIPAGSTINSVTLTLYMSRTSSSAQSVKLHVIETGWDEGTTDAPNNEGTGDTIHAGEASWLHTSYPSSFWTTPGGDYSATVSATKTVAGIAFYTWSSVQMAADVQAWLDAPAANFGWIVIGNEPFGGSQTAKRFNSRENGSSSQRPQLSITFTPGTPPAAFCFGDGSEQPCPCANSGASGRGCDNAQGTGGVQLSVTSFNPGTPSIAFAGSGFPAGSTPTVIGIRSATAAAVPPPFGDGLLCLEAPLVRFGATFASGGFSSHSIGHGAGPGSFSYQLWYRNQPGGFCDPAAFNLSNGIVATWP